MQMKLIDAQTGCQTLATGTDADLHKMVLNKQESGEWAFPVAIVKPGTKLITDQDYYATLGKSDGPTLSERLQMVKDAVAAGCTSLRDIEIATDLTRGQVRYIDRVFHPRIRKIWIARPFDGNGSQITADSSKTMADLLEIPVATVKQIVKSNGIALGYKITVQEKLIKR